jgi:ribonuclease HII
MSLESHYQSGRIELACDEAGRGCLAGAVYAAAVILKEGQSNPLLNDSKKLTAKKREALRDWIEEHTIWAVGIVEPKEIDEINILNASFLAMHRAIDQINEDFDHLLIDGNRFKPYANKKHHCIVKGDGKYQSIAAASILAKSHRDEYMIKVGEEFPMYGWGNNFGYPTVQHREAIKKYGISKYHRRSFQLLPAQMELQL